MNHDLSETLNSLHDMKPFVIIMWVWLSPNKAKLAKLDNLQIVRWEVVLKINNCTLADDHSFFYLEMLHTVMASIGCGQLD